MVDNRSAGSFEIPGGINFRGGDISGTAAKTSDDRASQGTEYFLTENEEQESAKEEFTDRSAQLRASLNSLALMNVARIRTDMKRAHAPENPTESDKNPLRTDKRPR
ncbi:MAG: hypothetical protein ACI4CY_03785 [Candidatus Gastranaerophilaceae bacterium]